MLKSYLIGYSLALIATCSFSDGFALKSLPYHDPWIDTITIPFGTISHLSSDGDMQFTQTGSASLIFEPTSACYGGVHSEADAANCTGTGSVSMTVTLPDGNTCELTMKDGGNEYGLSITKTTCPDLLTGSFFINNYGSTFSITPDNTGYSNHRTSQ